MGKGKRKNANMALVMIMIITMTVFFAFYDTATMDIANEYIGLLPSVLLITISIYGTKTARGPAIVGAFIMLGVGFALLTGELNTMGILVPDILTATFTLGYLQTVIVLASTIIGVAAN